VFCILEFTLLIGGGAVMPNFQTLPKVYKCLSMALLETHIFISAVI
jgi:hypothetical protein